MCKVASPVVRRLDSAMIHLDCSVVRFNPRRCCSPFSPPAAHRIPWRTRINTSHLPCPRRFLPLPLPCSSNGLHPTHAPAEEPIPDSKLRTAPQRSPNSRCSPAIPTAPAFMVFDGILRGMFFICPRRNLLTKCSRSASNILRRSRNCGNEIGNTLSRSKSLRNSCSFITLAPGRDWAPPQTGNLPSTLRATQPFEFLILQHPNRWAADLTEISPFRHPETLCPPSASFPERPSSSHRARKNATLSCQTFAFQQPLKNRRRKFHLDKAVPCACSSDARARATNSFPVPRFNQQQHGRVARSDSRPPFPSLLFQRAAAPIISPNPFGVDSLFQVKLSSSPISPWPRSSFGTFTPFGLPNPVIR